MIVQNDHYADGSWKSTYDDGSWKLWSPKGDLISEGGTQLTQLPKSILTTDQWWWTPDGMTSSKDEYKATDLTKKCVCGVLKTMGPDYPKYMHSDWCDMYEKEQLELKKESDDGPF